ncbi:MAG: tetratricopeptide repeat protein, partial [Candidatus Paceibacterota bacterium]
MKKYLILTLVILVVAGLADFVFLKFYTIQNGKIISLTSIDEAVLNDELSQSAQSGDVDKQIQTAEQLVSLKKDNQSKLDLANAYLEKASLDFKEIEFGNKALVLANEVITGEPNNYQGYLTAGYAYEVLQNYPKSLEQYNKAIELSPDSDLAYVKRGHAYDLSGDLKSAEADYIRAYQINTQNDVALMNLARIAQRKGDFVNAKKYAQTVIEVSKIAYVKATAYEII